MLLNVEHLYKYFNGQALLKDINFTVEDREAVGLIGINGCGKSTLLNIITGSEGYDKTPEGLGSVNIAGKASIGFLRQNSGLNSELTIGEEMKNAFAPLLETLDKMKVLEKKMADGGDIDSISHEYAELSSYFEARDGYRIDVKIKQVLNGMGFGSTPTDRVISTLSGGERQRVRIATQLTCSLKGLIYILDEPCKGLHYRDITKVVTATRNLVCRGNTVIAIEHNKQYISSADCIIELGPVGGPDGGYLIRQSGTTPTTGHSLAFKQPLNAKDYFEVRNINFRNIRRQNARFPIGGITCITGVSGSGKSTLASVIARCFSRKSDNVHGTVYGGKNIRRVIQVNQAPIGKTQRSTIVSYLEIFDEIRALFSKTDAAKQMKLGASSFSMNVKGGRCECCQGTGLQKIELNYLPNSYITCPECGGKRFNDQVLSVKYCGKTILDILETPIIDIVNVFKESKKVYQTLSSMIELGLGYLKLGQMSMNLSGGEAQRVKLAKALSSSSYGKNLYILDEPTSGLNDVDIDKFIQVLFSLQKNGETAIIIEHNVEFIKTVADHIIDFGISGGESGGKIVAQGFPEAVFANKVSSLYRLDKLTY